MDPCERRLFTCDSMGLGLSPVTFFKFFAAATGARIIAPDFGPFANHGLHLMMVVMALTFFVSVRVAIDEKPHPRRAFAELRNFMMLKRLSVLSVNGCEFNHAFPIVLTAFFDR